MDFSKLTEPLTPQEVEWRIQFGRNPNGTRVVPYITNRAIINRLNKHIGYDKWENEFIPYSLTESQETKDKGLKTATHAGFICKIIIHTDKGKITRQDTAQLTDIEALKGGASDSMKRAAVQFGMGIDLYDYPEFYIKGDYKYIPDNIKKRLSEAVQMFIDKKLTREVYIWSPDAS